MTSRPLTRLRAQARSQAAEERTVGQPRGPVTGLWHALTGPLQAPARPRAGEKGTADRALSGPLQAPARPRAGEKGTTRQPAGAVTGLRRALAGPPRAQAGPQAGDENITGQPRGALTGLVRGRPLAGEPV